MCVRVSLCTTAVHSTAQNSSDNLPSHPPYNRHCSDVVPEGQVCVPSTPINQECGRVERPAECQCSKVDVATDRDKKTFHKVVQ